MSPRAFRTMLVGPMGAKDRQELESRVLAAALKQSVELGDSAGVSLAHKQIFLHIRSAHGAGAAKKTKRDRLQESSSSDDESPKVQIKKKRKLPNIVWTEAEEDGEEAEQETQAFDEGASEDEFEPSDETVEIPLNAKKTIDVIQQKAIEASSSPGQSVSGQPDNQLETREGPQFSSNKKTEDIDLSKSQVIEDIEKSQANKVMDPSEEGVFDAYGILGIEKVASFEQIHVAFLVSIRKLLFKIKKTKRRKRKELLAFLQELWIAHDVLTDPVTRTDYDFRILGLRGAPDVIIDTPEHEGQVVIGSTVPLRIGELLQCAGLLEPTELEIAADMHKAMPEMLFGSFLVKQGFITEYDLEQVLMGQRLLKMGYMSVATFCGSMQQWIDSETPLYESAVTDGLLTISEMERIIAQGLKDTDTEIPAFQGSGQVGMRTSGRGKIQSLGSGPMINQEEANKRNVSANNAVPEWKDQLDWSAPPEEEVKKPKKTRTRKRTTIDTSVYQIEGVTTEGGPPDTQRKSLRSLMKGMHLDDSAEESESDSEDKSTVFDFGAGSDETSPDAEQTNQNEEDVINELKQTYGNIIQVNSDGSPTAAGKLSMESPLQDKSGPSIGKLAQDTTGSPGQPRNEISADDTEKSASGVEEPQSRIDSSEELDTNTKSAVVDNDEDSASVAMTNDYDDDEDIESNAYDEDDDLVLDFQDEVESSPGAETFTNLDQVPDSKVELKQSGEREKIVSKKVDFDETGDSYDALVDDETAADLKEMASALGESQNNNIDIEDPEESARQALKKSIEWQVMYKIKGNLADVLLSDSEEPDVPHLAPRLEDIDVIPKGYSGVREDEQGESTSNSEAAGEND